MRKASASTVPVIVLSHLSCAHFSYLSNRLDEYLKRLLMTQRKTAGTNYIKAITHGMPAGRKKRKHETE